MTITVAPSRSSLAWVSVRVLRRLSACALPRPSAIASAKLANSTVNHSHSAICSSKIATDVCPATVSRIRLSVVRTLVTSTTNMTGFLTIRRGSSLRTESTEARRIIFQFQIEIS